MKQIKSFVRNYMPKGLLRTTMNQYYERKGRRLCKQYAGDAYTCPCCQGHFRSMMDFECSDINNTERYEGYSRNSICPRCFSFPRHRIVCAHFDQHKEIVPVGKDQILMFGAERSIERWFKDNNYAYTTADLFDRRADLVVDILQTPFADNSWSLIICNHVLEHVSDFKVALKELRRILKKDGVLELAVPTDYQYPTTYEDPSVNTDTERVRLFGQADHLRVFGSDFKKLLEEAGFQVEVLDGADFPEKYRTVVGPANYDDNKIYLCRK